MPPLRMGTNTLLPCCSSSPGPKNQVCFEIHNGKCLDEEPEHNKALSCEKHRRAGKTLSVLLDLTEFWLKASGKVSLDFGRGGIRSCMDSSPAKTGLRAVTD